MTKSKLPFRAWQSYPTCVANTEALSEAELDKLASTTALNTSTFMVGTKDMDIVGTTADGKTMQIFKDGNFVI